MLVPPGKEEHRAASYGSRCDHAAPRPEPILTQESTMGSRNTWTAAPIPAAMSPASSAQEAGKSLREIAEETSLAPGTVAVPLRSQPNASPFWIMLLLVSGRLDNGMIRIWQSDTGV